MRTRWLALLVLLAAPTFIGHEPARAHAGGRVQLYIRDVRFQPAGDAWTVTVTLIDADSGEPQPGFAVDVSGTTADRQFGPVTLEDPTERGAYHGRVVAAAGTWDFTLSAKEKPGGPLAIPTTKRLRSELVAPTPGSVPASPASQPAPRPNEDRSSAAAVSTVLAGLAAGAVVVTGLVWLRRRSAGLPGIAR
jgi:hypothetical protein